jgi:hypothetical protein
VERGITIPLLLLRPKGTRAPAVLILAQQGKAALLGHRAPEMAALLDAGVAVCLLDVRGTGELRRAGERNSTSAAANELMLGNTLVGARLKDTRTAFRYLRSRSELDPARIAVWGDSLAAVNPPDMIFHKSVYQPAGPPIPEAEPMGPVLALLAGLYEPEVAAAAARRGLVSFLSVLESRFTYVPLEVIVPGILEAGDIPDLTRAFAPRPVLIAGAVDGRNQPVGDQESDPASVAAWLLNQLR